MRIQCSGRLPRGARCSTPALNSLEDSVRPPDEIAVRLLLAEYQIDDPAPADVRAVAAAVSEDVGAVAPRIL